MKPLQYLSYEYSKDGVKTADYACCPLLNCWALLAVIVPSEMQSIDSTFGRNSTVVYSGIVDYR